MSLSSLLRELCARGILEKKRDMDGPTEFFFVTLLLLAVNTVKA